MGLQDKIGNWGLCATWEKEKGVGAWDFKGKEGSL